MILSNRKINTRSAIYLVLPLFIGFIASIIILNYFSPNDSENKINFDELALGKDTMLYAAQVDNTQVHCHNLEDASHCIDIFLSITIFPITIISIFVLAKQAYASVGVFTMGSFSLNEVLRRIGTPDF